MTLYLMHIFFFSSRRRHTRFDCDWSSDVCSSDLGSHRNRSLRIPPAMGIVLSSTNSFGEQRRSMVNLTQVIKGLRAERGRAQKEVDRLEKAIAALGKLEGHSGRQAQRNEARKKRKLSAAARKRISQAQKARWAKLRQQKTAKA